jgi:hypothetical protein
MPIKDTFSYQARWDSVGLDCSNCVHFRAPAKWPDLKGESYCLKHNMSLCVELGANGFKKGEWFCKSLESDGSAFGPSVEHFKKIRGELEEDTLYGFYGTDGNLLEYAFAVVKAWQAPPTGNQT